MRTKYTLLAGLLATLAFPAPAQHEGHGQAAAKPAQEGAQPTTTPLAKPKRDPQVYFTDRELITQDGKKVRFYSDVLKGRMVVMNTIFTNCKDACPLITEQMNRVRSSLGDSFGRDVTFVSISIDPERDSPQAMKKFAQKHKADVPGWIWLTGKKDNIDAVLKRLGQWSEDVEAHSTQLIAWNFNTDRGRKMLPSLPPEMIAMQLKLLAGDDPLSPLNAPAGAAAPKTN